MPSAFAGGTQDLVRLETEHGGLTWWRWRERSIAERSFSVGDVSVVTLMIFLDGIVYGLLAGYVNSVWPGNHHLERAFYHILGPPNPFLLNEICLVSTCRKRLIGPQDRHSMSVTLHEN